MTRKPRTLLLHGGWPGHTPELLAAFAREHLLADHEVTSSSDLGVLDAAQLATFDLVIPCWTFGELSADQLSALAEAVENGLGLVAWHGHASAFLGQREHKLLLGGQFVAHPGGAEVEYRVNFGGEDPLCSGLNDFAVRSEQYYLLVDPAVQILATTRVDGGPWPWLNGVDMPVAWKRQWGRGRVFYLSLGHTVETLKLPNVLTLLCRAVDWARRDSPLPQ